MKLFKAEKKNNGLHIITIIFLLWCYIVGIHVIVDYFYPPLSDEEQIKFYRKEQKDENGSCKIAERKAEKEERTEKEIENIGFYCYMSYHWKIQRLERKNQELEWFEKN